MDPHSGLTYTLQHEGEVGDKLAAAEALEKLAYTPPADDLEHLKKMAAEQKDLVLVGQEAAQRARLGDRELRRRRQRRR